MKPAGADVAQLFPDAAGWRVLHAGAARAVPTLGDALGALPAGARLHLALPCGMALLERLTLPATDREELAGMVSLQLEKTLPYPVEEVASDFDVLRQAEGESTVLSVAVPIEGLTRLCQPLRERGRLPQKVTLFAQHFAAACPPGETVLGLWNEPDGLVAAVCEDGKLSWAHTVGAPDADSLAGELSGLLLSAELEGVPTAFTRARLAADCAPLAEAVRAGLPPGVPVDLVSADAAPAPEPATNLVPPAWTADLRRHERAESLRQRALLGAVGFLLVLAGAFVWLAVLKRQVQALDVQLAQARPEIEAVQVAQTRWDAMAPAIDPTRTGVETMFQLQKNLPAPEVKLTEFDYRPEQWMVGGEAPSAGQAIEFAEKLRAEPELAGAAIDAPPPQILPTNAAQFRIFGKR